MKKNNKGLAFGKKNYNFLIIGVVLIAAGLFIMTTETAEYGFGVRGLTIGPVIIMIGFITNFYAIFAKDKSKAEE